MVQLRRDNADGTVYNLVGFQTHLKFPEQRRVFSMIPALRNAEFLRYGVMHRNTFLDSPRLLDRYYRLKKEPRIAFAGQMTGVEGYVESAASGFLVGIETARRLKGQPLWTSPGNGHRRAGTVYFQRVCDPVPAYEHQLRHHPAS